MPSPGNIYGRSLSFPPRIGGDGRMVWSEGEQNIRESIRIILLTNLRERVRLAEFGGGLNTFLFEPNNVATQRAIEERMLQALKRWEPRIAVESPGSKTIRTIAKPRSRPSSTSSSPPSRASGSVSASASRASLSNPCPSKSPRSTVAATSSSLTSRWHAFRCTRRNGPTSMTAIQASR